MLQWRSSELPPPPRLAPWQDLLVGIGAFLVSWALRAAVDQVQPGYLVVGTSIPGLIVATYLAGVTGGLVVLAGGLVSYLLAAIKAGVAATTIGLTGLILILFGGFTVFVIASLRRANLRLADQEAHLQVVTQELGHRNRNLLAIVASLADQTLRSRGIDSDTVAALNGRIQALANAQNLITLQPRQGISLRRLVEQALAPVNPEPSRLTLDGGHIGIPGDLVSSFALVFHELGTNAVKYGAWSNAVGRVTVRWERLPSGVSVTWKETGGPPASPPSTRGLGSLLLERAISDATIERRFDETGAEFNLLLPITEDDEVGPTKPPANLRRYRSD